MDSYGLSKVLNEVTARSFQRRSGADIYALRIGNVIEPHEYDRFPGFFAHPEVRRRNTFSYIDARDLGQIVHLCLEKDGLGFQVFNAGNDDCTANVPTRELLERFYPGVPVTRELGEYEALYLEPEDPGGAGVPRGAQLAEVCEGLTDRLKGRVGNRTQSRQRFHGDSLCAGIGLESGWQVACALFNIGWNRKGCRSAGAGRTAAVAASLRRKRTSSAEVRCCPPVGVAPRLLDRLHASMNAGGSRGAGYVA